MPAHPVSRREEEVKEPVWGDREIAPPSSKGPCRGSTALSLSSGTGVIGVGAAWSRSKDIGDA